MPLREYRCRACGHSFEVLESRSRPAKVSCQVCHSARVERQLSVFATATGGRSEAMPACGDCSCADRCEWRES